mmetsp:Transcript_43390/g.112876  ORF Transcript_43390/g.112876 Transcript_43390/m.112876 type:complete len:348 (-) Transcript_43390:4215-5258(-)
MDLDSAVLLHDHFLVATHLNQTVLSDSINHELETLLLHSRLELKADLGVDNLVHIDRTPVHTIESKQHVTRNAPVDKVLERASGVDYLGVLHSILTAEVKMVAHRTHRVVSTGEERRIIRHEIHTLNHRKELHRAVAVVAIVRHAMRSHTVGDLINVGSLLPVNSFLPAHTHNEGLDDLNIQLRTTEVNVHYVVGNSEWAHISSNREDARHRNHNALGILVHKGRLHILAYNLLLSHTATMFDAALDHLFRRLSTRKVANSSEDVVCNRKPFTQLVPSRDLVDKDAALKCRLFILDLRHRLVEPLAQQLVGFRLSVHRFGLDFITYIALANTKPGTIRATQIVLVTH